MNIYKKLIKQIKARVARERLDASVFTVFLKIYNSCRVVGLHLSNLFIIASFNGYVNDKSNVLFYY